MDAAALIAQAAEQAGADLYAPGTWDKDEASSVALVLHTDRRTVLTINADDLIYVLEEGNVWGDLYVYGYRAEEDVTDAAGVLRALSTQDGASVDPQGDGIVPLHATDTPDIPAAIAAAMVTAVASTERYHAERGSLDNQHASAIGGILLVGGIATWYLSGLIPALMGGN